MPPRKILAEFFQSEWAGVCGALQDLTRVKSGMETIDQQRKKGLKKEQIEEYACCEKLIQCLEVRPACWAL